MSAASFDALGADRDLGSDAYRPEDFPGCESFHLPASEIEHYEGRLEFWDGVTETAWKVSEPTSIQHEQPSRLLVQMAGQFAMVRGSRIVSFGSADLVRLDAAGRRRWLMQADEVLYLHPDRVRLKGPAIDVDADPLPDVVLEVDHTTDVRRRKLGIDKESGFPEVWVLVPWEASVRAPGLAIHVRRGSGYREEGESRAFRGGRRRTFTGRSPRIRCRRRHGGRWNARRRRWVRARARSRNTIRSRARRVQGRMAIGRGMREVSGRAVHEAAWKSWPRRSGPGASKRPWTSRRIRGSSAEFQTSPRWRRRWRAPAWTNSGGGSGSSSICTPSFSGEAVRRKDSGPGNVRGRAAVERPWRWRWRVIAGGRPKARAPTSGAGERARTGTRRWVTANPNRRMSPWPAERDFR